MRCLALVLSILYPVTSIAGEWINFPKNFKWCVATAAHQIEGNNENSDWWEWEVQGGHIQNEERSGLASDHWNRVNEDVELMSSLGVNTYRFSIEWAKIEPQEGQWNAEAIQHYRSEVLALKEKGISVLITLHHFTLPLWVRQKGGWEWEGVQEAFARFAKLVYLQIAPEAKDWITFNEPMVHILGGYFKGLTPPGEKRPLPGIIPVIRGILRSHVKVYRLLHDMAEEAAESEGHATSIRVGFAHHLRTFDPNNLYNPLDHWAASIARQAWNWTISDATHTGVFKISLGPWGQANETIPGLKGTEDFIGVNYYSGNLVGFSFTDGLDLLDRRGLPKNDLGWPIYPEGLFSILSEIGKRYPHQPILITENGIADSTDQLRAKFIRDHLAQVGKALAQGLPVEAYCYWSLIDNFEWIQGFTPRFGLYQVDYRTYERRARPSTEFFSKVTHNNGFALN